MGTVNIDLTYKPHTQSTRDVALTKDDILVAKFTTPASVKNGGDGGSIGIVQHNASNWDRVMCISETPGDFTPNSVTYTKPNGKKVTTSTNIVTDISPNIIFNPAPSFTLLPNTVYYVNMKTVAASEDNASVRITLSAQG